VVIVSNWTNKQPGQPKT